MRRRIPQGGVQNGRVVAESLARCGRRGNDDVAASQSEPTPGGTITGMTAFQQFDDNGAVIGTEVYAVSDTGGLFRVDRKTNAAEFRR